MDPLTIIILIAFVVGTVYFSRWLYRRMTRPAGGGHDSGSYSGPVMDVKGTRFYFDGSHVVFVPNKATKMVTGKSGFRLPISAVKYVEYSTPTALKAGFLRVNAGVPPLPSADHALRDQHTVQFGRAEEAIVRDIKERLEKAIGSPAAPARSAAPASPGVSLDGADQLAKLAQLRDSGVLTADEFDSKKKQILDRM